MFTHGTGFYVTGNLTVGTNPLPHPIIAYNAVSGCPNLFEGCYITTYSQSFARQALNDIQRYTSAEPLPDRVIANWNTHTIIDKSDRYQYIPGAIDQSVAVTGLSDIVTTSTELQFSTTAPEDIAIGDWIAGDYISANTQLIYKQPMGYVTDIAGNTVTCLLICPQSEAESPGTLHIVQHREFAPKSSPVAAVSTTSADITFSSSVANIFQVGDWIQGNIGMWDRYRIAAVSVDGLTVSLNKKGPIDGDTSIYWGRLSLLTGALQ